MITLHPRKRYGYNNGREYAELNPCLKRLQNRLGTGLTWYLVYSDGKKVNTMLSASGKERCRKRNIKIFTK